MHSLHEFVNFLYGIQAVVMSFASLGVAFLHFLQFSFKELGSIYMPPNNVAVPGGQKPRCS